MSFQMQELSCYFTSIDLSFNDCVWQGLSVLYNIDRFNTIIHFGTVPDILKDQPDMLKYSLCGSH